MAASPSTDPIVVAPSAPDTHDIPHERGMLSPEWWRLFVRSFALSVVLIICIVIILILAAHFCSQSAHKSNDYFPIIFSIICIILSIASIAFSAYVDYRLHSMHRKANRIRLRIIEKNIYTVIDTEINEALGYKLTS